MGSTLVVSWYTGHFHRSQHFQSLFHIFYCTLSDTVSFNYLTSGTSVKWTIHIPSLLWFIYSGNIYHADCMRILLRLPHSHSHLRHNRPIGYSELSISWYSPVSLTKYRDCITANLIEICINISAIYMHPPIPFKAM